MRVVNEAVTKDERQQQLINAREACEWVRRYTATIVWINASLKERLERLIAGFELLDAKEQAQIKAGRASGKLGAKHGVKGGRPRKNGGKK